MGREIGAKLEAQESKQCYHPWCPGEPTQRRCKFGNHLLSHEKIGLDLEEPQREDPIKSRVHPREREVAFVYEHLKLEYILTISPTHGTNPLCHAT